MKLDGCALLVNKFKGTDPVEWIDFSKQERRLGVSSAIVIAALIGSNTALKVLVVGGKDGHDLTGSGRALGEALKTNSSLEKLEMVNCKLGPEDAKGLAGGVAVNTALKELSMPVNSCAAST